MGRHPQYSEDHYSFMGPDAKALALPFPEANS